jgi:hypothetical protein
VPAGAAVDAGVDAYPAPASSEGAPRDYDSAAEDPYANADPYANHGPYADPYAAPYAGPYTGGGSYGGAPQPPAPASRIARAKEIGRSLGTGKTLALMWGTTVALLLFIGLLQGLVVAWWLTPDRTVTFKEYSAVRTGMSQDQVTSAIGTPGTMMTGQTSLPNGIGYLWVNEDGSFAEVVFVEGAVADKSEFRLEQTTLGSSGLADSLGVVSQVVAALESFLFWATILYTAAMVRGYVLTIKKLAYIAGLMAGLGLICGLVLYYLFSQGAAGVELGFVGIFFNFGLLVAYVLVVMGALETDVIEAVIVVIVAAVFGFVARLAIVAVTVAAFGVFLAAGP